MYTCASETASRGKTNDSRFLLQVRLKLPLLYLIDSIVKNVGEVYKPLFQQEIVGIFVDAFDKVSNDRLLVHVTAYLFCKYILFPECECAVEERQGAGENVCTPRDLERRVPADEAVRVGREGEPDRS